MEVAAVNRSSRHETGSCPKLDDQHVGDLIIWGGPVRIRCAEGYTIEDAVLKDVGTYAVLIETPAGEGEELLFKHAILSIARMSEEEGTNRD